MQKESQTSAAKPPALPDAADCRNPEPRDPVAHPHDRPRPALARRYVRDLRAESGSDSEQVGQ